MKMKPEETHKDFNNLITRKLSGELTPEQERDFQKLLRNDSERESLFQELQKIWNSAGSAVEGEQYNLDAEWDLMQDLIPNLKQESQVKQSEVKTRSLLYYTYRVAAMLLLGLIIGLGLTYGTRMLYNQQIIAWDQPVDVILEDGTLITINRDSRIRFKKKFASDERKVFLKGEAWFDVASDPASPFVIDAGSALVEVLGTSFNVNAYRENPVVEITVESGVVALTSKQEKQEQIVLKAGNSGKYNKQRKELELIQSSNPNQISWKTRELYFDGSSLQEVVDLINQVYDAHLVISNDALASCQITVTFKDQSLDAILNVLESTLDLEILQVGNQFRLEGSGCNE